jgi:hypothetical protein
MSIAAVANENWPARATFGDKASANHANQGTQIQHQPPGHIITLVIPWRLSSAITRL